jgi:hypothetical protein
MNIFYQRIPDLAQTIPTSQPKDIGYWVEALAGNSVPSLLTMGEMISHVLHSAIGDRPYDPLANYSAQYALTSGIELARKAHGFAQSRAQFRRIRDSLAAFGCFTVPERKFVRYSAEEAADRRAEGDERVRAGQMKRGANLGKKHAGEIFDIDVERMLDIEAAIIQILKSQETIDGVDGWTAHKPAHGFSWMAKLWKRVKGFGTLFTPEKHEGDRPFFEYKPRVPTVDARSIENEIGEWWSWHNHRAELGEKVSPMAWKQLDRLKRSLERVTEWMREPDDGPEPDKVQQIVY